MVRGLSNDNYDDLCPNLVAIIFGTVKFYGSFGGFHLQIDSGLRGQVLGAIGFPLRRISVRLVKDSSGLMSLI